MTLMPTEKQPLIRDMELIRRLLIYIAENGSTNPISSLNQPEYDDYNREIVWYHLSLMHERGLFKGYNLSNIQWSISVLTWDGQDFLQMAQDDTIWNKAKDQAGSRFGSLTLDVLRDLLLQVTRRMVGLDPL